MQAAEHIGLADFPQAANEREAIQMYMATLYGFVDATSPDAVAHLNAWRASAATRRSDRAALAAPRNLAGGGADADCSMTTHGSTIPLAEFVPRQPNERRLDDAASNPATVAVPANGGSGGSGSRSDERGLDGLERDGSPLDEPVHQHGQAASPSERFPSTAEPPTGEADDRDVGQEEDAADTSAVAAMRRFWDSETAKGRIPTGAQLSRAAGVPPSTGLGRRKRREWEADLPEPLKAAAGTSR